MLLLPRPPRPRPRPRLLLTPRIVAELFFVLGAALVTNLIVLNVFGLSSGRDVDQRTGLGLSAFRSSATSRPKAKRGRFPSRGTPAFEKMCDWTANYHPEPRNCITLVRLLGGSGEGLSSWVSTIAGAHILTKQTGCRLMIDYGPNVDFQQVLVPEGDYNWTVPPNFKCTTGNRCSIAGAVYAGYTLKIEEQWTGAPNLVEVPNYRIAFTMNPSSYDACDRYRNLSRAIPGFEAATGMSCSLGSLLRLAPTAERFEPRLFDALLPALRSPHILSLSVYIRTGHTEKKDLPEEATNLEDLGQEDKAKLVQVDRVGACALRVERQLRTEEHTEVVWMLITDSQLVKRVFPERFRDIDGTSRRVLTTSSRGAHTKPQYGPSTADFAEAFIDWYLIGEADAVVDRQGSTFGKTGAFRTLRRYFQVSPDQGCEEVLPTIR